jgi:voltage-dependent anion channel protein 2
MPTKYGDIAKAPKDILSEDYTDKVTLKAKKNAGPVAVTLETARGSGGALSSKVGTKFAYAGLSFDKVQLTADGGQVLETSLVPCEGVKLSFKGNKGADLGIDYTKGNLYATGVLDVKDMSKVSTSACLGLASGFTVGGDATYALSGKTGFSAYNVGASYSQGKLFASVTSASKLSSVNVGCVYKVNADLSLASSTSHSSEKACAVNAIGAAYKAPIGDVKAKIGSDGILSACLIKEVAPKVTVTASGAVSTSDLSSFKYGLGIVI